jgi:hypothetical protein
MATTKRKPGKAEQRIAPAAEAEDAGDAGDRKPPESAENFEHVLRRLIAARDSGPPGA